MCGISGIFSYSRLSKPEEIIGRMNKKQKHRGPDDEGLYVSPNGKLALGHVRLSIIDLSTKGHQPMETEDGRFVITYNGEVYNYLQLRKRLERKGYRFFSNTDTEVVLKLYAEYGKKALDMLRGMFAFAIYDKEKDELFLARDRLGQKPLVYSQTSNGFIFASELPALLETGWVRKEINLEALGYYFLRNFFMVPEPLTIFEDVYRLPPAHYMVVRKGGIYEIGRYWRPSFKKKKHKNPEKKLRSLLKEAVEMRLIADVPIGLLLSGGVDSSSVAAMVGRPLVAYAFGSSAEDEELERARKVANLFNLDHKEILLHPNQLLVMKKLIKIYGEPLYILPQSYAHEIALAIRKDGIKVALTGNGGDEVFYGYNGSNRLLLLSYFLFFFDNFPSLRFAARLLSSFLPQSFSAPFALAALPMDRRKGELYRREAKKLFPSLFLPEVVEKIARFDFGRLIDETSKECDSPWYIDVSYWVGLMLENAHSVTVAGDLPAMANGVEFRAPFLDHKLIEFALTLPPSLKVRSILNKAYNKYILKKAMEGLLPKSLLYAKKMGFGFNVNVAERIRNEWREEIENTIFSCEDMFRIINKKFVETVFREHLQGKDHSKIILAFYGLAVWWKEFLVRE